MVEIRRAQIDAADALGAVMWDAVHNGRSAYSEAQRRAWVPQVPAGADWAARLRAQRIWVAERDGALVGFVTLAAGGYVDFAFVLARVQGRGVFRALLDCVEAEARADGAARLWTHASLTAQPAFAALGFHVMRHEVVARQGETLRRAVMEKPL
ncbi:MAG: GNAT family N-acetyltransferase [Pseudomonadota bacterium]